MGTVALIGLGSNVGDRKAHLDSAVAALMDCPGVQVRAVSPYRETEPVGGPAGQKTFLNGAAALETSLEPLSLLRSLQDIEHSQGRSRALRWAERTLDLDLILYGSEIHHGPELRVPHPRMWVRRFLLAPLAEIASDVVEPVTGLTVRRLLENIDRRPSRVALIGPRAKDVCDRLITELPARWFLLDEDFASGSRIVLDSSPNDSPDPDPAYVFDRIAHDQVAALEPDNTWIVSPIGSDLVTSGDVRHGVGRGKRTERLPHEYEGVIRPTFLAATDAFTYEFLGFRLRSHQESRLNWRNVPVFWPLWYEAITFPPSLPTGPGAAPVRPPLENVEELVAEIVHACRATRSA